MLKKITAVIYPLLFSGLILGTSGCQDNKTTYQTDLDYLYSTKPTEGQRDSISKAIEPQTLRALKVKNIESSLPLVDSVLDQLSWTGNKNAFLSLSQSVIKFAQKNKDLNREAKAYQDIAFFYNNIEQSDSVYHYYLKAENVYSIAQDSLAMAENKYYQSRLLYRLGLFSESKKKLTQSIDYLDRNKPKSPILIEAYQLMIFCQTEELSLDQAQTLFDQALDKLTKDEGRFEILTQQKYYSALTGLYTNLASYYLNINEYKQAELTAQQALTYLNKEYSAINYAYIHSIYALAKYYQGNNENIIEDLLLSYDIQKRLDYTNYQVETSLTLGDIYNDLKQKQESLDWTMKAYTLAKENNLFRLQKEAIELLLLNDKNKATALLIDELIHLNRKLDLQQQTTREKFTEIEYESFTLSKENEQLKYRITIIIGVATVLTILLVFVILFFRLKSRNKALESLNLRKSKDQEILNLLIENNNIEQQAVQNERNRVAKDLHDGVINSLFTIRFNLQQLESKNTDMQTLLINELLSLEQIVRDISHALAQSNLFKNKSFENLIVELVQKQSNSFKTVFNLHIEQNLTFDCITTIQKVNIYHILQEALQNINKHSKATECLIDIAMQDHHLVVLIKDNGVGIAKNKINGLGLASMKERAKVAQATLNLSSKIQKGTSITLTIDTKQAES
ncbi:ATP-binding protein [Myroides pelagicus]|uniref:histidine kinase n=1 Tax=Myroides pelagicus TaxID=270914 RepID=A0A7K1GMG5_9FLAO|nr:ATP-binding protein [Myroides pelagicus]MTH29930.1 histidine kinase [Myroides pelagicus]